MQQSQAPSESGRSGIVMHRLGRQTRRRGSVWLVPTTRADTASVAGQEPETMGALALDDEPACADLAQSAPTCVLIVEDDPQVAGLLRSAFELDDHAKWSVDIQSGGRAALLRAQQTAPRIVLLDVRLPDMEGAEVFRQLRDLPGAEHSQVLFLTASNSLDLSQRGVDGGLLLRKPFDVEQVIALVSALLQD